MKRTGILILILLLIVALSILLYGDLNTVLAEIKKNNVIEINTSHKVEDFIDYVSSGTLQNKDEVIQFDKIGIHKVKTIFLNDLGIKVEKDIEIKVVDTIAPEIEVMDNIIIYSDTLNEKNELLNAIDIKDNSKEDITPVIVGDYDINEPGDYNLKVIAQDSSNNTSSKDFTLSVIKKVPLKDTYYVKINKTLNVIMVYKKDSDGNYTKLVKTFVASAGKNTPVGVFKANGRHEVISFPSGTYGHYATRIYKSFWFHSVPYQKRSNGDWNTILYDEYNKLGNWASAGCIRLQVIDAKWIYENIVDGSIIEIYESNELPEGVVKPTPQKIDVTSENRGWDPTDPNPNNPWK